ncbi:hypothetical protein GCM10010221_59240 [Streptomyces parvus]|nr:hypothetical protein GCM10010221_59240 [Streptomyces parvus]
MVALVCAAALSSGCAQQTPESKARPASNGGEAASPSANYTQMVHAAVQETLGSSARTVMKTEMGTSPGEPTYTITAKGAHDFARNSGNVTAKVGDVAEFDQVLTDDRIYVRGGTGTETMPWSYTDRADAKVQHMLRPPGNDAAHLLQQASMSSGYERFGTEKVAGAATTRYSAPLSHKALAFNMTKEARGKSDQLRDMMGGEIPVTTDVWVDGEGRAVRVRLSLDIPGSVSSTTTLTLSDLGLAVKITVPTAEGSEESEQFSG